MVSALYSGDSVVFELEVVAYRHSRRVWMFGIVTDEKRCLTSLPAYRIV